MELTESERSYYISYLIDHTTYSKDIIYDAAKNDDKLYSMTDRIIECMHRYPIEIYNFITAHPELKITYTLEELKKMTYNDLADLRRLLKIRKRGNKVISTLSAEEISKIAASAIKENPYLEQTIIDFAEEPEDLAILTSEEIEMMYPGSYLLTEKELHQLGVTDETVHNRPEVDPDDYFIKIGTIVDSGLTIDGEPLTYFTCSNLPLAKIEELYAEAQKLLNKKSKSKKKV